MGAAWGCEKKIFWRKKWYYNFCFSPQNRKAKARIEAPFEAQWIFFRMPTQRLAQAKKTFAALSQEKRISWNCEVWCVTIRNCYSWAGWTGFVVQCFCRNPFKKNGISWCTFLGICLLRKPLLTATLLLQSTEKPQHQVTFIYIS